VFGFAIEQPNGTAQVALRDNVYSCRELIHAQAPSNGADFGVIRLDRPVTNHVPLRLRQSGAIRAGDGIFVVGHPAGLPQKLADGATVRSVNTDYFVANLDTYGGNSGSAVFNAVTREVEGILVRGETDFVSSGSCQVSNRCSSSGCRGEDVTRIDQVLSFLPSPTQPPPPPEPSEFSATPNLSIPDRNMTGVSSQIQVTRTTAAQQIQVKVNIRHTYRGDLKIVLVAPDGTNVVLKNANSSDGQDDVAGTYGDTLTSVDPLARLSNRSVGGIWTLKVADTFRFDRGTLVSWSVRFL
jgi:subtilisin-like proprotein convertase family protein